MISRGDVWWAVLPPPAGTSAGFRRPVVVVQGNSLNESRLGTVVCVPLTSNLGWARAPGNVLLGPEDTGLEADSVANVTKILALDKHLLTEPMGRVPRNRMELIFAALDVVLDR